MLTNVRWFGSKCLQSMVELNKFSTSADPIGRVIPEKVVLTPSLEMHLKLHRGARSREGLKSRQAYKSV